jgi:hypothetical protein
MAILRLPPLERTVRLAEEFRYPRFETNRCRSHGQVNRALVTITHPDGTTVNVAYGLLSA